jgi:hypothetical protein
MSTLSNVYILVMYDANDFEHVEMEFNWCRLPDVTGKVRMSLLYVVGCLVLGAGTWGVGHVLPLLLGSMYHAIN